MDFQLMRWLGGWVVQLHYIPTSWLHLARWNLPDFQLSWKSKMELECGNMLFCSSLIVQGDIVKVNICPRESCPSIFLPNDEFFQCKSLSNYRQFIIHFISLVHRKPRNKWRPGHYFIGIKKIYSKWVTYEYWNHTPIFFLTDFVKKLLLKPSWKWDRIIIIIICITHNVWGSREHIYQSGNQDWDTYYSK